MCGICGFAGFNDKALLKKMASALEHRGPDGEGLFEDKNFSLGHRRLSIIDLSEKAKQPMCNEDKSAWLVFNGEIYNFGKLRAELEQKGHKFASRTDSEVIIHGYEEFGEDVVKHLDGMFAFAIYDSEKKSILLARDRLGKKPLYYAFFDGKLIFASEIKALLECSEIPRKPNLNSISYYLTMRVIPTEHTLFMGVKKLLPGEILYYEKGKISTKQYWDFDFSPIIDDELFATGEFMKRFREAVEKRLVADVPIGAFLSGGVDSSAVVAVMSALSHEQVKTFTVGFGREGDEFPYAKAVAEHFNTEHHELVIDLKQMAEALPKVVWNMDEPVADPTIIPTYFLSKFARKKVTVALLGEGSDELFAGYTRYGHFAGKRFVPHALKVGQYLASDVAFRRKEKMPLLSNEFKGKTRGADYENVLARKYFREEISDSALNQALYFDLKEMLPNYQLMRVDKLTMAHGLEARAPFLDLRIAEFSAQLIPELKFRNGVGKYLPKRALSRILPGKITSERKRIFSIPMKEWFDSELKDATENILNPIRIEHRNYFKPNAVQHLFRKQQQGLRRNRYSNQLWMLLLLEMWHQIFIDSGKTVQKKKLEDFY